MLLQSQDGVRTILGSYIWRWSPKAIGNDDDHLCKEVIFRLLNGENIWAGLIKWYYISSAVRLGTITDEHSFEVKQKVVNGNSWWPDRSGFLERSNGVRT